MNAHNATIKIHIMCDIDSPADCIVFEPTLAVAARIASLLTVHSSVTLFIALDGMVPAVRIASFCRQ